MGRLSSIVEPIKGIYHGDLYNFTHRNPKNGYLWADDLYDHAQRMFGKWVPAEKVKLLYD